MWAELRISLGSLIVGASQVYTRLRKHSLFSSTPESYCSVPCRVGVKSRTESFSRNQGVGCAADDGAQIVDYACVVTSQAAHAAEGCPKIKIEDCATPDSDETNYSETDYGEDLFEDLVPGYGDGDGEENILKASNVDKLIKKEKDDNEGYLEYSNLPAQIDSQKPLTGYTSDLWIKRQEEDWSSPTKKRRASQGIEDAPNPKSTRNEARPQAIKYEDSAADQTRRLTTVHPNHFYADIQRNRTKVVTPGHQTKGEVKMEDYDGPEAQHPWLGRFRFTKRHNNNSLIKAISSVFTDKTSKSNPPLSQEQLDLILLILSGSNVFYSGSAGSGKSTVMKVMVEILMTLGVHVSVLTPTGRAALAADGITFFSYAAWTPNYMKRSMERLKEICHNRRTWKRLNHTEVMIVDEVSMFENHKFERLNCIMKEARRQEDAAFGGVQLIVTGDFCQLPPVLPFKYCYVCGLELSRITGHRYKCKEHGEFKESDKWAFKSKAWEQCDFTYVNLKEIHRQSDPRFICILETMRLGKELSRQDKYLLLHHKSETTGAVKLFPTRGQVSAVNDGEFALLESPIKTYHCRDHFQHNPTQDYLASKNERNSGDDTLIANDDHRYEGKLELREGMLVILLVNLDLPSGLINGSQGVVTGFTGPDKPQDATPNPTIEYGLYKSARVHEFIARKSIKEYPVVRFTDGQERTIFADCQVDELGHYEPYSLISRTQIPLMAAWAMTIHKCQGMTLSRLIVDLSDAWARGQDYVALSRARSLEGLKVVALSRRERAADPQVLQFLWEKFGIG